MKFIDMFVVIIFSWVLFCHSSYSLQNYHSQALLQIRKHLEYPMVLDTWENNSAGLCYLASTPRMSIKCENNFVSELRIMGDKHAKVSNFNGFSLPNKTLSEKFSMDSFFTTLTRLSTLRVLRLVSLGIWGPISDKIRRLNSLEILDLSSNFIYGSIPPQISELGKLQSLRLDANFFNDTVPDWLNLLSNLTVLNLKNNQLKGQLPSSLGKVTTLTAMTLSHNKLSGKLPDFGTLTSLHVLDLGHNHFNSNIPNMPKTLVTALLGKNLFSGKIPDKFGKLDQLQHLDLSFNFLIGTPPSILFSLPRISYLDLSSNLLNGSLSKHLNCGVELGFVDISDNKFIGELPSCLGATSNERTVKFAGNCLASDCKNQHQESYPKKFHPNVKESSGRDIRLLLCVIGGAIFVLVILVFGVVFFCKRCRSRRTPQQNTFPKALQNYAYADFSAEFFANASNLKNRGLIRFRCLVNNIMLQKLVTVCFFGSEQTSQPLPGFLSQSAKFRIQRASTYRIFFFKELKDATNNFNHSAFIGEGSNGQIYKGRLKNGAYVAIRRLTFEKRRSIHKLKSQLDLLSKLHHPHLVGLLGHCIDGGLPNDSYAKGVFLVYEYIPSGNYHTHLSENRLEKVLKWSDRLTILIGVAKAVHFLHTGVIPSCFNNRLKTDNILLDEHHVAKLSDYGLSIFHDNEDEKYELEGEGLESWQKANPEDDVYNFGFILLESLVGPVITGKGEIFLLNEMASFGSQDGRRRIVDPIVLTSCCQESLSLVVSITNKCISPKVSDRPSFEDVLWNLQYAAQVQATAEADQRSDANLQL